MGFGAAFVCLFLGAGLVALGAACLVPFFCAFFPLGFGDGSFSFAEAAACEEGGSPLSSFATSSFCHDLVSSGRGPRSLGRQAGD